MAKSLAFSVRIPASGSVFRTAVPALDGYGTAASSGVAHGHDGGFRWNEPPLDASECWLLSGQHMPARVALCRHPRREAIKTLRVGLIVVF
jgi:hypothetical protein